MNHADTALTDKESDLVNSLATRLRLVQSDLDGVEGEERRLSIKDELTHTLKDVPARDRQRILSGLLRRFPVAGQVAGVASPAPAAPVEAPVREPETPDHLLQRFLDACGDLDASKRKEWIQRLAGQGMVEVRETESSPAAAPASGLEVSVDLLTAIGMSADQPPQVDRVFLLLGALTALVERLDQATDRTMQELSVRRSPSSSMKKLPVALKEYLLGSEDNLDAVLQDFSARLGALVTGMLVGGRNYGSEFLRRCSPEAIEEVVKTEGRHGFRRSFEVCCWDKYKDLARGFATAELIERQIKECTAKVVKSKLSR